ncbi:MAG: HhH-GPD family protein [Thermoleophilia bacterium]|nr:HhH-GPD family protein [Thermoleophilia bacterium]
MSRTKVPTKTSTSAKHLWLTDEEQHCSLLAADPNAFLIGFILDQQVTVQKAFRGPADLRDRIGTLDPGAIAAMPLADIEAAFAEKPALHRFPSAMAARVHEAMRIVHEQYGGNAARIWWEAADIDELRTRLTAIPGLGAGKLTSFSSILVQQCGVPIAGWEQSTSEYGTLGDVDSPEALKAYQTRKRAFKKAAREAAAAAD